MKILFGVLNWGLGHATRDIPLIQALREAGHHVTIASSGAGLGLLQDRFPECFFRELPEYPSPYRGAGFSVVRTLALAPQFLSVIKKEQRCLQGLLASDEFDRIISDSRYGLYEPAIPSFLITHQLRFIAPGRFSLGERLTEHFNRSYYRNFKAVLVPDFEQRGLSGDLSHNLKNPVDHLHYIGHITDLKKQECTEDIDYFITLSGPEPQRTRFEELILSQLDRLTGKVVVALAKPGESGKKEIGNATVFPLLSRSRQAEYLNRAKMVITRSGYTTLMELAELGKKALLVPTPGQTEQEYLAGYHQGHHYFHSVPQARLDLGNDVKRVAGTTGFKPVHSSAESVKVFLKTINV